MFWFILAGVALLAGGGMFVYARSIQGRVNLIKRAIPITAGDFQNSHYGEMVSLDGVIHCAHPLHSEHSQRPCVYYCSKVIHEYETRETRNTKRGRRTRMVRKSETISSNENSTEFEIRDDSGSIPVRPDGAYFVATEIMNRFENEPRPGPSFDFLGASFNIGFGGRGRTIGYRYQESIIPVDRDGFVLGVVTSDGVLARPSSNMEGFGLIVSDRRGRDLLQDWRGEAQRWAYIGLGCGALGIVLAIIGIIMMI